MLWVAAVAVMEPLVKTDLPLHLELLMVVMAHNLISMQIIITGLAAAVAVA
jgi:hypothetical protein